MIDVYSLVEFLAGVGIGFVLTLSMLRLLVRR